MEESEKLQILSDLIAINTINGNELESAQYIQNLLVKYGIKAEIDEFDQSRANLVAEIGDQNSDMILGFTGHQDTVAVSQLEKWNSDPFKATIDEVRIYGRGAADMKSGLAAEIIALIELKESNQPINGRVRLLLTSGEELGAQGAYHFDQSKIKDLSYMVVGEPTEGNVTYSHSGSLNYRIISHGKAYHSSVPQNGINAISGLVEYINQEKTIFNDLPTDPILGDVQHSVTVIDGGSQVNIIPDHAELQGNIRPTKAGTNEAIIEIIQKTLAKINQTTEYDLEFELIHNFYPVVNEPDAKLVDVAIEASKKYYTKHEPKKQIDNGATDASVFVQYKSDLPVVILGPDNEGSSHQINEHTTVNSFLEIIDAYKEMVRNLL
ncbi:ArgE/DapE family deacylase [Lactobacillus sp. S2-2]|uniref:ArgE/DapE family deacylase n=1 Tax=Lactobacillus sp. S2-2 TaxID=2692917 RepID=UPI001F40C325|nr:ArgE/DapE family deacylase [Lactobacillus sp. S2-2]MCF6515381.1 ArgE/DapE family deacylase [Lactobacillus sp. S2-2]